MFFGYVSPMLELELRLEYDDARTAESVMKAVGPDNGEYVDSESDGNTLIFRMKAEDAGSLRNTADDLLVCIKTAEEASGIVTSAADLDSDSLSE